MSAETLMAILKSAAANCSTVHLSLRALGGAPAGREVEPYSVHPKDGKPTLFCWDVNTKRVAGLPLDGVLAASITPHVFSPRYEMEL